MTSAIYSPLSKDDKGECFAAEIEVTENVGRWRAG